MQKKLHHCHIIPTGISKQKWIYTFSFEILAYNTKNQTGMKVNIDVKCKASYILIIYISPPTADILFMTVVKMLNFQFPIFSSLEEFPRNTLSTILIQIPFNLLTSSHPEASK